jgi:hypothetical protein
MEPCGFCGGAGHIRQNCPVADEMFRDLIPDTGGSGMAPRREDARAAGVTPVTEHSEGRGGDAAEETL